MYDHALSHTNRMWWLCPVCLPGTFPNLPLSLSSLSGPAPGSGWRGWWPSQSPQTPVSQPPGPVIPSSAPVTSIPPARAFYIYTGTFKQVVFKYSDTMILLFVQCENVPTGVVCMYQHCTYYLYLLFKIKYDKNDDDIYSKILLRLRLLIVLPLGGRVAQIKKVIVLMTYFHLSDH